MTVVRATSVFVKAGALQAYPRQRCVRSQFWEDNLRNGGSCRRCHDTSLCRNCKDQTSACDCTWVRSWREHSLPVDDFAGLPGRLTFVKRGVKCLNSALCRIVASARKRRLNRLKASSCANGCGCSSNGSVYIVGGSCSYGHCTAMALEAWRVV